MTQAIAADLQTAMASLDRRPAIRMTASGMMSPIPMAGSQFSGSEDADYSAAATLALSDGRIAVVYNGWGGDTILSVSNVELTSMTSFNFDGYYWGDYSSIVELADGRIGIVYTAYEYGNEIGSVIVDPDTGAYSNYASVRSPAPYFHAVVTRRADGSYIASWVDYSGGTFSLNYKTSMDFITWSAQGTSSLSGVDPALGFADPSMVVESTGEISLFFAKPDVVGPNGEWMENIYHYVSTDGGVSFNPAGGTPGANPGEITTYDSYSPTGWGPSAAMSSPGYYRVAYTEQLSSLYMDKYSDGWYEAGSEFGNAEYITVDVASRRMAVLCTLNNLALKGIQVIDMDTWEIVKSIFPSSIPTFSDMWWNTNAVWGIIGYNKVHSEGGKIVLMQTGGGGGQTVQRTHIAIYDYVNDSIQEIHFDDVPAFSVSSNASPLPQGHAGGALGMRDLRMEGGWLDSAASRLYVLWTYSYVFGSCVEVGYIDVAGGAPYTYTTIMKEDVWTGTVKDEDKVMSLIYADEPLKVYLDQGVFVVSGGWSLNTANYKGYTRIYSMSGARIADLDVDLNGNYPWRGLRSCVLVNGVLYGAFLYEPNLLGESGKRGIWAIDLASGQSSSYIPTHYTREDYFIKDMFYDPDTNSIFMASLTDGILALSLDTFEWAVWNQYVFPEIEPGTPIQTVAYDPSTEMLYGGGAGIEGVSLNGILSIPKYVDVVSQGGGSFSYGSPAQLVNSYESWRPAIVYPVGSADAFYFWTGVTTQGNDGIFQGQAAGAFRLDTLLAGGTGVTIKRSITGKPNTLEFSVVDGHLFDPHNRASLWSGKLVKGQLVVVEIGEVINGSEVLHPSGYFIITDTKVSYKRGAYPVMTVSCEDFRTFWKDMGVVATEAYEAMPEFIVEDILATFGGVDSSDMDFPALAGGYIIQFQWLDSDVQKIVDTILNRFGYFCSMTPAGIVTARPISIYNPVDHSYDNDLTKVIDFTPDDSFSDFTNRVIVTGESQDFVEVLYEEEPVGMRTGTTGWWGGSEVQRVWYSDDHKRRCRVPRLEVIGANSPFSMAQPSLALTFIDVDELFCEVTVTNANLITEVAMVIIAMVATGTMCGMTKLVTGACFIAFVIELSVLFYLICQIGQYQYQIHAQPYGEERLGVQGQADDFDMQALIGRVVEKKIDEPLCVSAQQCTEVANHELMIVMAQRKRATFSKIADLRDDEGDTISIAHPHSSDQISLFITDVTRTFTVPKDSNDENAGVFDQVEGWVI